MEGRAAIQSISRNPLHWEPLVDVPDVKVRSSDQFCERLITGDGKRFVAHADERLTAFIELELAIRDRMAIAAHHSALNSASNLGHSQR